MNGYVIIKKNNNNQYALIINKDLGNRQTDIVLLHITSFSLKYSSIWFGLPVKKDL